LWTYIMCNRPSFYGCVLCAIKSLGRGGCLCVCIRHIYKEKGLRPEKLFEADV
jgi:hypothetical protein